MIDYKTLKATVDSTTIALVISNDQSKELISNLKGHFTIKVSNVVYWEGTSLKLAVEAYNKLL